MWLIFALLIFLAAAFVIYPLIRTAPKPAADEVYGTEGVIKRANIDLFNEQLAVLDKQLFEHDINDAEYAELVAEQKRLLLADASQAVAEADVDTAAAAEEEPLTKGRIGRGAWLVMASMLLVPLLAFSLYQMLGASEDMAIAELLERRASVFETSVLQSSASQANTSEASTSQTNASQVETYVALGKKAQRKISSRLESKPDHMAYWLTLARLQMEENNFQPASHSYQRALELSPDSPEIAAEYAQVLYFVAGNKFEGESEQALDRALLLGPDNTTALGLQGIRAFGDGNYELALNSWQKALAGVPPGSQQAQALQSGIVRVESVLAARLSSNETASKKLSASLKVKVVLSETLKASPDQSVYVFAREWQGRPMPLAVVKLSAADLPTTLILDDSMAMPGGKPLSSVPAVQIVARVSSTGSAIPSAGDFEGVSGEIAVGELNNNPDQDSPSEDSRDKEIQVLIVRQL